VTYETLSLQIEDHIARLRLTRPDRGNAIDARTLRELHDACGTIDGTESVTVVLLQADGDDFCIGWDPVTRVDLASRRGRLDEPALIDPFAPLAALPVPVVAALNGRVRSAGLELALCCDVRLAANDASFSLPDLVEAHLPLAGATQRLPRIAGQGIASAMLLLGQELDGAAARHCGLVSRLVLRDDLSAEADRLARTIASRGPIALRYAKEALHRGLDLPMEQALRYEADLSTILQSTRDRAEGLQAFFEKRPPKFEGK
jgi:enoyl-CoA hydratase